MGHVSLSELFPSSFFSDKAFQASLGEQFQLCDNGNMIFHWADFADTCEMVKNALHKYVEANEDFKRRESALNKLNQIPVWIRTDKVANQTTMFDLYERYILNQTRLSMGVDPFGPIEVSFISSTGPFKKLALVECFNQNTYRDFVMVFLLKGNLPKRDFRVRLKSKVLIEYGSENKKSHLINLEQLTSHGILLSLDSDVFIKEISIQKDIRLLIDSRMLKEGIGKDINDLRKHLSQYAFNLLYSSQKEDSLGIMLSDLMVQSSFDFLKNKKVFLFAPYDKLQGNPSILDNIQRFMAHTKNLVSKHFKQYLEKSA